jgi:hypothetical protein
MAILSEQSQLETTVGKLYTQYKVFNDASAAQTTSDEIDARNASQIALLVEANTGVSGGVVTLEGAPYSSYAGTWLSLGTVTTNAASKLFGVSIGGGTTTGLPVRVVRARISTVISGGTIDAYIAIQK